MARLSGQVLKDFPCVKSNLEDAVHTKVLEDLKRIKSRMSDCAVLVASGALQDEQEVDEVQEMTGIDRFAVSSTGPSFVLGRNR